ncbi:MAG: hypothetical protein COB17_11435 [Sulfurimonas sp.]|nr:MAG: hypothetical protein COB17_11435 [Sulfurimonas sp.]
MAVVFESTIKMLEGSNKDWYIELRDTVDNRLEICLDLKEYSKKVEELGSDYGGNIDEVKWMKDDNVPLHIMDNLRFEMSKLQAEIEEETGKSLINEDS